MTTTAIAPMKLIVDREALAAGLSLLSRVVRGRTFRPQLACVKLEARKEGKVCALGITATDSEVSMRLSLPKVDTLAPGACLVPADRLTAIVGVDSSTTLTLEMTEPPGQDSLTILGERCRFTLFGYPVADAPPVPDFGAVRAGKELKAHFTCDLAEFNRALARTEFAVSTESSRYALAGVLLRLRKDLEVVATDGRRMAWASLDAKSGGKEGSAIVPTKAVRALRHLLAAAVDTEAGGDDAMIECCMTDAQFLARLPDGTVLASNLIEGTFPPYENYTNEPNGPITVNLKRTETLEAVRAARMMTEEYKGVRFALKDGALKLSSRAPERGDAAVECPINSHEGGEIEIGLRPEYVIDVLSALDDEAVKLTLDKPNSPCVFHVDRYKCIVMPVTLE